MMVYISEAGEEGRKREREGQISRGFLPFREYLSSKRKRVVYIRLRDVRRCILHYTTQYLHLFWVVK
jgi:hypothetical protein